MPTERERQYYRDGYSDGFRDGSSDPYGKRKDEMTMMEIMNPSLRPKRKRKLSAWQRFVKANSKKPRFRYKSGAKRGKINLKALGVAYRKKKRR